MSAFGSGSKTSLSEVRMFLRATNPERLVALQLQTNIILKGQASYTDFTFVDGQWYCWFLVDVGKHKFLLDKINMKGPKNGAS